MVIVRRPLIYTYQTVVDCLQELHASLARLEFDKAIVGIMKPEVHKLSHYRQEMTKPRTQKIWLSLNIPF